MEYRGSCHCGKIAYTVDGELSSVIECNCSHCSRKGYLLWFIGRDQLKITTPESDVATYTFNKHLIQHHFCATCGCAPFGVGVGPNGVATAAINVRCLDDVDLDRIQIQKVDGRSF